MSGLLFLLFINDIAAIFPNIQFWMFADDLKLAMKVQGPRDAAIIQDALSCLSHWCSSNSMVLNIDKCSVMSYHKTKSPFIASYQINGRALTRRESVRDLGVTFVKNLTFVTHISCVREKALKMLGFIYRNTKEFSSVATLKVLYYAYVRSVLEYCSII